MNILYVLHVGMGIVNTCTTVHVGVGIVNTCTTCRGGDSEYMYSVYRSRESEHMY